MRENPTPIPYGLCECGCGQPTTIATYNNTARGVVRGKPRRFISGHNCRLRPRKPLEYRIDAMSGCWVWQRSVSAGGYGVISMTAKRRMLAHRASWEEYIGPIPNGLCVLHRCDNPLCINPDHLFLGTRTDNMIDKTIKRRGTTKLTPDDVREIRRRAAAGESGASIQRDFSQVGTEMICDIISRKSWKWLD